MRTIERPTALRPATPDGAPTGTSDGLTAIRQAVGRLTDAGDDAIRSALSLDSREFLRAGRQQSGQ